jgi:hypothetical protein
MVVAPLYSSHAAFQRLHGVKPSPAFHCSIEYLEVGFFCVLTMGYSASMSNGQVP